MGGKNPAKRKEVRKKISDSDKILWKDEDYRKRMLKAFSNKKPQEQKSNEKRSKTMELWHKNNKDSGNYLERNKKISENLNGRKLSLEHRKKISGFMKRRTPWNKGKKFSKEARENMRKAQIGKKLTEETKRKLSISTKKLWKNEDYRRKCSQGGWKMNKEGRRKISLSKIGGRNPAKRPEVRIINSKKSKERWKRDEYKHNWIKALSTTKSNKKEGKILEIINTNKLSFRFVGNAKKWITGKTNERFNPDFIDEENKKIIEFFGSFWHKERGERDKRRLLAYKRAGYNTLVIKEQELENISKIQQKIMGFAQC